MVLHRCHLPLACPLALDHLLAVKVTTEDQLAALQSVTCLMGPFYQQLKTCQDWLLDNGARVHCVAPLDAAQGSTIIARWGGVGLLTACDSLRNKTIAPIG